MHQHPNIPQSDDEEEQVRNRAFADARRAIARENEGTGDDDDEDSDDDRRDLEESDANVITGKKKSGKPSAPVEQKVYTFYANPGDSRHKVAGARNVHALYIKTMTAQRAGVLAELAALDEETVAELDNRPRTRADCENGPRPCPFVGCRFNLAIDVTQVGSIVFNFPNKQLKDMPETCALDVVDKHPDGLVLEDVAALVNLTRERVRQIELEASKRLNEESTTAEAIAESMGANVGGGNGQIHSPQLASREKEKNAPVKSTRGIASPEGPDFSLGGLI